MQNIKHTCDNCGKEHLVHKHQLKNKAICCSRECSFELKKRENNVVCYVCGKAFSVKPSYLAKMKNPDRITCSYDCSKAERSERFSGEGNHQYGLKGDLNKTHKSDFMLSNYGYVLAMLPEHPKAMSDGYVFFHRLLMEEYLVSVADYRYLEYILDRWCLREEYHVHHKNEKKLDNTLDNLEILHKLDHTRHHATEAYKNRTIDDLGRLLPSGKATKPLYKKHSLDAGLDISATTACIIPARGSSLISTELNIAIPAGYVGLLWSRSGLSVKNKIEVGAGCIDCGYTGEVKVHLYNHSDSPYQVNVGDRIAQLLTIPINYADYHLVNVLEATERGEGGFGHTGRS